MKTQFADVSLDRKPRVLWKRKVFLVFAILLLLVGTIIAIMFILPRKPDESLIDNILRRLRGAKFLSFFLPWGIIVGTALITYFYMKNRIHQARSKRLGSQNKS